MAHFAKVNNGIVEKVIVAEESYFDTFVDDSPGKWIQTSYNTFGGAHLLGGTPLRKNFAAPGYTYNKTLDAFIAPKPYPSWTLNETTCLWEPPVAHPGGMKIWDEANQEWDDPVV